MINQDKDILSLTPENKNSDKKSKSALHGTKEKSDAKNKANKKGKGKKKDLRARNISSELIPIEEETWLIQPIAVTMMRHDYSLLQIRILVSVVASLQTILHSIMNNERNPQLELFHTDELDDDGKMPVKIPFKSLGVDPNHYSQLKTSLQMLASIPVQIPYKSAEGRKYTKSTNLCDVYIPEDVRYDKYAVLKLDKEVATRLVSLDMGYQRLGKQIVFACKNRYTQRIYMFIESWLDKGRTVIKTLEFRRMLRLENSYKKFSDFCRRVLEPAKDELKDLADKGYCDCYFNYEKKYDKGQRGGEPDELVFHIFRAKNAINQQLQELNKVQQDQVSSMLVRYFNFTPVNAAKMAKRVNADSYGAVMNKLGNLVERFHNDPSIKDKAAYTFKSLDEVLKEYETPNTEFEVVEDEG